jgi:hypothetical protein
VRERVQNRVRNHVWSSQPDGQGLRARDRGLPPREGTPLRRLAAVTPVSKAPSRTLLRPTLLPARSSIPRHGGGGVGRAARGGGVATSAGESRPQLRYAGLRFRIGERDLRLTGFTDPQQDHHQHHTRELFVRSGTRPRGGRRTVRGAIWRWNWCTTRAGRTPRRSTST